MGSSDCADIIHVCHEGVLLVLAVPINMNASLCPNAGKLQPHEDNMSVAPGTSSPSSNVVIATIVSFDIAVK